MKTYQKYFLVYSFLGVVLISAATLAHGIEPHHAHPNRHSIDAHDVYKWGWIILGISTFLIVIDCLRSALKENRRVLNQK